MESWKDGNVIARLLRSFVEVDSCWVYTKNLNWKGYGTFKIEGKFYKVHRVSFYLFNGELVSGLVIDHICYNRACFNPKHLRQVTNAFNLQRPRIKISHRRNYA